MTLDAAGFIAVGTLAVAAIVFIIRLEGKLYRQNDKHVSHEVLCAERYKQIDERMGEMHQLLETLVRRH